MSKHKNPIQKKNDRYNKDRIIVTENPHMFRKNWPRKKAGINQEYRSKIRQLASRFTNSDEGNDVIGILLSDCKRESLQKWNHTTIPLRNAVTEKFQQRAEFIGQNYFKHKYYHALDADERARFKKFIQSLLLEKGIQTQRIAKFFHEALTTYQGNQVYPNAKSFLEDFFEQEPDFKIRILDWIDRNK